MHASINEFQYDNCVNSNEIASIIICMKLNIEDWGRQWSTGWSSSTLSIYLWVPHSGKSAIIQPRSILKWYCLHSLCLCIVTAYAVIPSWTNWITEPQQVMLTTNVPPSYLSWALMPKVVNNKSAPLPWTILYLINCVVFVTNVEVRL